ncbi:hypothetical protein DID77_04365 [Candidatus Marinamargulisbacteria bacterium SCGC AG-439-L15]|nr:hypothetical protein DID77_04365 [Candidatus Marinamargulisbacteria bacterium SCGC AG-439-L15]
MSGKIISIVNQKGGVGKTTTAINLSAYLSELGHKVLVLDMDPQANATSGLGMNEGKLDKTVYDLLHDPLLIKEVLYPTPFENLHIIPSTPELAGAEVELADQVSRETLLRQAITPLKEYYDYIVIDCAPSLGLLTINALVASDETIIPLQCEYFALEGVAHLTNTVQLIKQSLNPSLCIGGIVLTMYDPRTSLNKLVARDARQYFEGLVFDTMIPRNVRLAEAPSHGLPVALYDPKSKGGRYYYQLAKEYIKNENKYKTREGLSLSYSQ